MQNLREIENSNSVGSVLWERHEVKYGRSCDALDAETGNGNAKFAISITR